MSYEEFTKSAGQDALRLEVSKVGINIPRGSERQMMYVDVTLRARVFRTTAQARQFDPMRPNAEPMTFESDIGVLQASRPMEDSDHLIVRLRHCEMFGDKDVGSVKVYLNELPLIYDDLLQVKAGPFFFTLKPLNFGKLPPDGHVAGSAPIFEYAAALGGDKAKSKKKGKKKKGGKMEVKSEPTGSTSGVIGDAQSIEALLDMPAPAVDRSDVDMSSPTSAPPPSVPGASSAAGYSTAGITAPDVGGVHGGARADALGEKQTSSSSSTTVATAGGGGVVVGGSGAAHTWNTTANPPPPARQDSSVEEFYREGEYHTTAATAGKALPVLPEDPRTESVTGDDFEELEPATRGLVTGFGLCAAEGTADSVPDNSPVVATVARDGQHQGGGGGNAYGAATYGGASPNTTGAPVPASVVPTGGDPTALQIHLAPDMQGQLYWSGTVPPVPPYGTFSQVRLSLAQRAIKQERDQSSSATGQEAGSSSPTGAAGKLFSAVLKTVNTGAAKLHQGVEEVLFKKAFPEQPHDQIQLLDTFRPAMLNGRGTPIDGTLFITSIGLYFDGPLMHYAVGWGQIDHYRRSTSMGDDAIQIFTQDRKVWQLQHFDGVMAKVGMLVGTRNQSKFMEALHLMGFNWWSQKNRENPEV